MKLKESINKARISLTERKHVHRACAEVCELQDAKAKLEEELFEVDDRLLEDKYDKAEADRLKREIKSIEGRLSILKCNP